MRKVYLIAASVLIASGGPAYPFGLGQKGKSGAQFLKVGPGARPGAMGEAFAGVGDDIHAVYYNPAGLAGLTTVEVAGMHNALFQGINYEFAAVSIPLLRWRQSRLEKNAYGVMGISIYNLSTGGIERRTNTETDEPVDTFTANDFAYAFTYAYAIPDTGLSLGITGKFIDSNIDTQNASALAVDLGALYRWERFSLGAGARHLGSEQKFGRLDDQLPLTLFVGSAYRLSPKLLMTVDVNAPRDGSVWAATGLEYKRPFNTHVDGFMRGGYNSRDSDAGGIGGSTFGLGLRYYDFNFDFAWLPYGQLGHTFRYALHVKF